jgi:pimeloyl-ACP methyl ester carboxylesterase
MLHYSWNLYGVERIEIVCRAEAGMATAHGESWGELDVREDFIEANGQRIAITRFGQGPALVVLHGIGSRGTSWLPIAERLAQRYDVIAIDQRGHGASSHPEQGYLIPDYAADLAGVLDQLGLEAPLIMGHSLGGMVTLEWARRHPGRAAALVIEDSPMRRGGPGVEELFDGWIALSNMSFDEARAYYASENPGWTDDELDRRTQAITSVAPGVFYDLKANMVPQGGASVIATFAGIQSPTLLIHGDVEAGGMVPEFDAMTFSETVPNVEIARIPAGNHSLHRDTGDAFLAIAEPFLARYAARATWLESAARD